MHVEYNKDNASSEVKIFKNKSFKNFKRGGGAPARGAGAGSAFDILWEIYQSNK